MMVTPASSCPNTPVSWVSMVTAAPMSKVLRTRLNCLLLCLFFRIASLLDNHIVIVDGQQLLYHVTWPCGGDPSVLVTSMKARLASLADECVLVFDRYDHVSPKDQHGPMHVTTKTNPTVSHRHRKCTQVTSVCKYRDNIT